MFSYVYAPLFGRIDVPTGEIAPEKIVTALSDRGNYLGGGGYYFILFGVSNATYSKPVKG